MDDFPKVPNPVNTSEQYLHGIMLRTDALCHMMSSFIEAYAKQNGIAFEDNSVKEKPATTRKRRTTTQKG